MKDAGDNTSSFKRKERISKPKISTKKTTDSTHLKSDPENGDVKVRTGNRNNVGKKKSISNIPAGGKSRVSVSKNDTKPMAKGLSMNGIEVTFSNLKDLTEPKSSSEKPGDTDAPATKEDTNQTDNDKIAETAVDIDNFDTLHRIEAEDITESEPYSCWQWFPIRILLAIIRLFVYNRYVKYGVTLSVSLLDIVTDWMNFEEFIHLDFTYQRPDDPNYTNLLKNGFITCCVLGTTLFVVESVRAIHKCFRGYRHRRADLHPHMLPVENIVLEGFSILEGIIEDIPVAWINLLAYNEGTCALQESYIGEIAYFARVTSILASAWSLSLATSGAFLFFYTSDKPGVLSNTVAGAEDPPPDRPCWWGVLRVLASVFAVLIALLSIYINTTLLSAIARDVKATSDLKVIDFTNVISSDMLLRLASPDEELNTALFASYTHSSAKNISDFDSTTKKYVLLASTSQIKQNPEETVNVHRPCSLLMTGDEISTVTNGIYNATSQKQFCHLQFVFKYDPTYSAIFYQLVLELRNSDENRCDCGSRVKREILGTGETDSAVPSETSAMDDRSESYHSVTEKPSGATSALGASHTQSFVSSMTGTSFISTLTSTHQGEPTSFPMTTTDIATSTNMTDTTTHVSASPCQCSSAIAQCEYFDIAHPLPGVTFFFYDIPQIINVSKWYPDSTKDSRTEFCGTETIHWYSFSFAQEDICLFENFTVKHEYWVYENNSVALCSEGGNCVSLS